MQVYFDEQEIIARCIKNDRQAQARFYQRFNRPMFAVCMRYAADQDAAADILQEGFIKAFRALDKFTFTGSLEGWVRRIMVNTALDHYRKNAKLVAISNYDENISDTASTDVLSKLAEADLLKLVQTLPDGYRTVFNLYVVEGYAHAEIADMLNISEGTSKSQLSRAKGILKSKLIQFKNHNFSHESKAK